MEVILVDAGDFVGGADELASIKTRFLVQAFALLGQDALNLGEMDFVRGPDFAREVADSLGVPLVSANLVRKETGEPVVSPYVIRRVGGKRIGPWLRGDCRIGIFGVLAAEEGRPRGQGPEFPYAVVDPRGAIESVTRRLRGEEGCDVVILLCHMGLEDTRRLAAEITGVDLIVGGHGSSSLEAPEKIGDALLVQTGSRGMHLGDLTFTLVPEGRPVLEESRVVRLDDQVPEDGAMALVMEEYGEARQRFLEDPQEYPASLAQADQVYMSVEACVPCHEKIVSSWRETGHGRALEDLAATGDDVNPECVRCHTTGYLIGNGFVHRKWTPHLTDVQCESCHGPGVWHLARLQGLQPMEGEFPATDFLEISPQNCSGCHRSDRDHDFDFERDRRLIAH